MKPLEHRKKIIRQSQFKEKYITEDCGFLWMFGFTDSPSPSNVKKPVKNDTYIKNRTRETFKY